MREWNVHPFLPTSDGLKKGGSQSPMADGEMQSNVPVGTRFPTCSGTNRAVTGARKAEQSALGKPGWGGVVLMMIRVQLV